MRADLAIQVEGLGKEYILGRSAAKRPDTLRDAIAEGARGVGRKLSRLGRRDPSGDDAADHFWALRDVGFEVRQGEAVGIIGRNGAGKSTLLKILSRITEPSAGRVTLRGRIGSLLEVGTGFHPELTGRENIFLNGAILGMSRAEVRRKFDEIVDFAGVERFIDTPVKRYSSGMYVRLAFAVAAQLEPEILIVDEVLAVGDAEFQKKCLGRMSDVAGEGRTVLFVSHNMAAVRQLCTKGILLASSRVQLAGPIDQAISSYLDDTTEVAEHFSRDVEDNPRPKISRASVAGLSWDDQTDRLILSVDVGISSTIAKTVCIDFRIRDRSGMPVGFASSGALDSSETLSIGVGVSTIRARLDITRLAVGAYTLSIDINVPWAEFDDRLEDVLRFEIGSEHWRETINPLRIEYGLGAWAVPAKVEVIG